MRFAAGLAIAAAARMLGLTLRCTVRARAALPPGPLIFAFKHGQQLALLNYPRPRPTAALVSHSTDGALQTRVLTNLGLHVIRGSSSRGGAAALRASSDWLASGRDLAMAVDGPRGPEGRTKPGVIWLAQKLKAPIVPVACAARPSRRLARAWDRFLIPAPFARVPIVSGEPYRPWENDWTWERKLSYLDSLIETLETYASRETGGSGDGA